MQKELAGMVGRLSEKQLCVTIYLFFLGSAAASAGDGHALQLSIESLFVSICQKKHYLYRQNGM